MSPTPREKPTIRLSHVSTRHGTSACAGCYPMRERKVFAFESAGISSWLRRNLRQIIISHCECDHDRGDATCAIEHRSIPGRDMRHVSPGHRIATA
eukprot:856115-Rhodomonas_salina.2